jgi:branched-chain amino acid transport system substrate-binding protein
LNSLDSAADSRSLFVGAVEAPRSAVTLLRIDRNGNTRYIYPEQYEGQECDPLIFCTGPVPAQQLGPFIPWLMQQESAKKF